MDLSFFSLPPLFSLLFVLFSCIVGSMSLRDRVTYCAQLRSFTTIPLPPPPEIEGIGFGLSIIDYQVRVDSAEWEPWKNRISSVDIEPQKVVSPDVVIDTVDTVRHTEVLSSFLLNTGR